MVNQQLFFRAAASLLLAANFLSFAGCQTVPAKTNRPAAAKALLPLKVTGTRILNLRDQPVRLCGVNAASLEWTSDGDGRILQTINVAIHDWRVNLIRLPLSQD